MSNEQEEFNPDNPENVQWEPVETAADFKKKVTKLASNAIDVLNNRITSGMYEASDIKTALEFMKHSKVGIETVDEAVERALQVDAEYEDLEEDVPDDAPVDNSMRFQG